MTREEVDGEWSQVCTFYYVSFVKLVSFAAEVISGFLAFFLQTPAALSAGICLLALLSCLGGRAEVCGWNLCSGQALSCLSSA